MNTPTIRDISGIEYFHNLNNLECNHNQLTSLPRLPSSLDTLDCSYNKLGSLPTLPPSLINLNCYKNQLASLPTLTDSLISLNCGFNQIVSLGSLPLTLKNLYSDINLLVSLPSLPDSLVVLNVAYNQLTALPILPASLVSLGCMQNQLTTLPSLPSSITFLQCASNDLTSLPSLPTFLTRLECENNQLLSLPYLPPMLTRLNCSINNLTTLPTLPNSLFDLDCRYNQLTSLPDLPNSLNTLVCMSNQFTEIPELPDSLYVFYCFDNPNLTCLHPLKKVAYFNFSNTGLSCIPNYPLSNTLSTPPLNTLTLCNIFNTHGCPVFGDISGKVYQDTSSNCMYDLGETTFSNLTVQLYENGLLQQETTTAGVGNYFFITGLSTYEYSLDTTNLPFSIVCPDSGYFNSNIANHNSFVDEMNFGLHCKSGFDIIAQNVNGRFRPGNTRQVDVSVGDASNFYGARCATGTSGSVQLIINGSAHYASPASGAITPTTVVNDTITWNIPDFGAVNFFSDFNINVATDTIAVLGSQICFTLVVNPIAGDNNPANNILTQCFTIVGSFDPNEKEMYPAGNIDTAQKWLTYTIHFQNTGTAEAQHIYVTDTLDSNVDAASFQLLAYSHQPMVQIKENAVRFNFPNINLPDSNTNKPLSHGYVQYKVKLKNNLPLGTTVNNTAFIYFDFNSPVVTNTTTNTITTATGISKSAIATPQFAIFPNPATNSVTISIDEKMLGSTLTVYDITGRKMSAVQLSTVNRQLSTENFSSGIYLLEINKNGEKAVKRLVKE